jgi:3-hydroxymyristoyl/3-hydroxydecanoyl-(acyl carrier protein) dehydratase
MSARPGLSGWLEQTLHPDRDLVRLRAERWNALLEECSEAPATHLDDPLEAFALLLACWSRGWAPLFLPDRQATTVRERSTVRVFLDAPGPGPSRPLESRAGEGSEVAVRLLTSGSTGARKEVPKTFGQIEGECRDQSSWSGAEFEGRRILTTVSHQHIYGLLFLIARPALESRPFPRRRDFFWEEMVPSLREGPCLLVASPSHLPHVAEGLSRAEKFDLQIVSSGGSVSESVGPLVARHAKLLEVYGSTETGGVARRIWTEAGPGSWIPFPSVEWRIQEEGRLVLESPWADSPGPHLTDDLAESLDGGFQLRGRFDRIVKVSEKRLSLDEMEARLREDECVCEARVCLLEGERRQEVAAVVEPDAVGWRILQEQGRNAFVERLRRNLSDSFETVLLPRHFRFGAIPRNAQGKFVLEDLLEMFRRPELLLDGIGAAVVVGENGLLATLTVPRTYPRLDGHFPSNAVVPGVAQLHWAMQAAQSLQPDFRPRGVHAVKFHSILRPDVEVRLDLARHRDGWKFEIETTKGRKVASGRILP